MRKEGPARGRQDHPDMRPPEERRPELLLEPLEARGKGRLADRQGKRGAAHVPLPGDFDEPFDLGKEQGSPPAMIGVADITRQYIRLDGSKTSSYGRRSSRCHHGG
jgi:hypothetical protein